MTFKEEKGTGWQPVPSVSPALQRKYPIATWDYKVPEHTETSRDASRCHWCQWKRRTHYSQLWLQCKYHGGGGGRRITEFSGQDLHFNEMEKQDQVWLDPVLGTQGTGYWPFSVSSSRMQTDTFFLFLPFLSLAAHGADGSQWLLVLATDMAPVTGSYRARQQQEIFISQHAHFQLLPLAVHQCHLGNSKSPFTQLHTQEASACPVTFPATEKAVEDLTDENYKSVKEDKKMGERWIYHEISPFPLLSPFPFSC